MLVCWRCFCFSSVVLGERERSTGILAMIGEGRTHFILVDGVVGGVGAVVVEIGFVEGGEG